MQKIIRKLLCQRRQLIPIQKKRQYAQILCERFLEFYPDLLMSKNKKIASYYAMDQEISPCLIDQSLNVQHEIYYPIIHPFRKQGLFFSRASADYCYNKYGLKEPLFSADKILAPWELDLIIVPLVGFDFFKNRIGMGGGFYDNSLRLCKAFNCTNFVGVAFDEQQFNISQHNLIAMNDWDIKMDIIITPRRIIR